MTTFNHRMAVQQSGDSLASLRDAMVLADGCHGLIRFDRENPRSKLLIAETEELAPIASASKTSGWRLAPRHRDHDGVVAINNTIAQCTICDGSGGRFLL